MEHLYEREYEVGTQNGTSELFRLLQIQASNILWTSHLLFGPEKTVKAMFQFM